MNATIQFTRHRLYSVRIAEEGESRQRSMVLPPSANNKLVCQTSRMFTIIRHPIERVQSLFYSLSISEHISLEMWARSRRVESNRLTRFLSNQLEGELTQNHLNTAKEVLRRKCIVGLFEEKVDSWLRFQRYFQWKSRSKDTECIDRYLSYDWKNKRLHPTVEEGSNVWNLLLSQNEFDMEIYHFALRLYEEQKVLS